MRLDFNSKKRKSCYFFDVTRFSTSSRLRTIGLICCIIVLISTVVLLENFAIRNCFPFLFGWNCDSPKTDENVIKFDTTRSSNLCFSGLTVPFLLLKSQAKVFSREEEVSTDKPLGLFLSLGLLIVQQCGDCTTIGWLYNNAEESFTYLDEQFQFSSRVLALILSSRSQSTEFQLWRTMEFVFGLNKDDIISYFFCDGKLMGREVKKSTYWLKISVINLIYFVIDWIDFFQQRDK